MGVGGVGPQAGSPLCCQRRKLLNYKTAILQQRRDFWVAVMSAFL